MAIFRSVWDDINSAFRTGNMVTRLMIVNLAVFVLVCIVKFGLWMTHIGQIPDFFDNILYFFCMPAQWFDLLTHPWGLLTSMFLHEDFWHVLNNIIFLYLFGTIVGDLIGDRRVLPLYLLGGITGSLLFMLSDFFVHYPVPYALGASGAVMALAGAVLILAPDYRVMLLLLGEVKIKYVVLVMVLLDLVGMANNSNTGGHVAHIGGFVMGCLFVYQLREGKDWAEPINRGIDWIKGLFNRRRPQPVPKRRPHMVYKAGGKAPGGNSASDLQDSLSFQERIDAILDKIKAKGYESLTQEEKDFLYRASRK
jgi:membrane associated rhomboid family serine protease